LSYRRYQGRRRHEYDNRQKGPKKQKKYEENGIVLEVIPTDLNRRRDKYKDQPIVQVIGMSWFTLLEIIPIDENAIMLQDSIVLSKEERSHVKTIIGRIYHENLTSIAELQLPIAIDSIIEGQHKRFVSWLNQASPISIRLHSLHLLKGIGPKSLDIILKERKLVPFTSFEDFEERTKIKDITTLIKQRIIDEITSDEEKHRLFTRPMPKERY
jgi:putative nucleotide binding protein